MARAMSAILIVLVFGLLCGGATAAPPRVLGFQGYLTTTGGAPVNASVQIVFRIYSTVSGGAPLWTETRTVAVSNGVYSVDLGAVAPLALAFDEPYFLGISVGIDAEMVPRAPLSASPYAVFAAGAGCRPGDLMPCYDGPGATFNRGICRSGLRACNAQGTGYGPCVGAVLPHPEVCDGLDNDCNGFVDDVAAGCVCTAGQNRSCYSGAPGTAGFGTCVAGSQFCTAQNVWGPCVGQVTPAAEVCDGIDNDCNGIVDLDVFPTKGTSCEAAQGGSCVPGVFVCAANAMGVVCNAAGTYCPNGCVAGACRP